MEGGLRLGRIFGIPVKVSKSWFVLIILATFFMASIRLPPLFPEASLSLRVSAGVLFSLLFFGSVLFHELAHSLVALASGLRVTSVTILIFGGFTAVETQTSRPGTEAWVALAGPLASFLLGLSFLVLALALEGGSVAPLLLGNGSSPLAAVSLWLSLINLVLAALNMLPGLPLDGGRVFQAVMWRSTGSYFRGTIAATSAGQTLANLQLVFGILMLLLGQITLGTWLIVVGWFLRSAARGSRRLAIRREALKDLTVRDAMESGWPRVQSGTSVRDLGEDDDFMDGRRSYLVYDGDEWVGMIAVRVVKPIPLVERGGMRVVDLMVHRDEVLEVSVEDRLTPVLEAMEAGRIGYVPILEGGRIRGVVARQRILDLAEEHSPLRRRASRPV